MRASDPPTAGPTGERFVLAAPGASAEIAEVGAALRALRIGDVDLFPRYPDDLPTPAAAGVVLVPWPNRIRGGEWTQHGQTNQLAITEPRTGNASHGLLRFAAYRLAHRSATSVTLEHAVFPQTGYPFHLETRVTYTLENDGIEVRHDISNGAPTPPRRGGRPPLPVHQRCPHGGADDRNSPQRPSSSSTRRSSPSARCPSTQTMTSARRDRLVK